MATRVENDLGWALGAVFRAYVRTADAAMAELPGGPRGYQVLAAAVHDAPRSQLALAHDGAGRVASSRSREGPRTPSRRMDKIAMK